MQDWLGVVTAVIQLVTAIMMMKAASPNKKGTKRKRRREGKR